MAGTGFELSPDPSGNSSIASQGGAKCGALGAQNGPFNSDLATVIEAWPGLSPAIRTGILAMVLAAEGLNVPGRSCNSRSDNACGHVMPEMNW